LSLGGAGYRGEGAVAVNFAYRLKDLTVPVYLSAGYSNGGGTEHIGKGAVTFVW
jgi:hypothetical protein